MEYTKDSARLVVPDRPNVRQQLEYYSLAALASGKDLFTRYWLAAAALITEWECPLVPDISKLDIETETDPDVVQVLIWAGLTVQRHVSALEQTPKN